MLVVVNPSAGGGRALQKWRKVESSLRERLGSMKPIVLNGITNAKGLVGGMIREGETEFIAAGGDGTVNFMLQSIVEGATPALLQRVKIGAIGIGSSNDFHKPIGRYAETDGIPCRINFRSTIQRDVGRLTYEDDRGEFHTRYWIVNASIGVTADANLFFNTPCRVMDFLKRSSTSAAILYAALHTVAMHRNRDMTVLVDDDEPIHTFVTNLGVVKSPHLSGNFCYDSPLDLDSGYFYVHLCENMSMRQTFLMLRRLSRGKFSGHALTRTWRSRCVTVRSVHPFAVEFDGEVITTRHASFSVIHRLLQVCT